MHITQRLGKRLLKYSGVGTATYILDLSIVALLAYVVNIPYQGAVATGFLVGLTVNYIVSYLWVFRGTKRNKYAGYVIFLGIATLGVLIITSATTFLVETFALHLLVARTLVAGAVGLMNFLLNTFFNFKIV